MRGANGVAPGLLLGRQFLAEPRHGAVEVVQGQAVHVGDGIVGQPLLAGPVRAGDHQPVQHGGKHRALDGKLEQSLGQQCLDHRLAAGLFPQAPEQQRRADPFGQHAWSVEIGLQRGEQQHLLAVSRSRPDTLAITVQVELGTGYPIGDAATGAPGRP